MGTQVITSESIKQYIIYLIEEERSKATVEKYSRDLNKFMNYMSGGIITKENVVHYKSHLIENYKAASVNSMLAALNGYLDYSGLTQMKTKLMRVQKRIFISQSIELTKKEYERLLVASNDEKHRKTNLIIQTICSIGIRVSELQYITVDALKQGKAVIHNKGKIREIYIPKQLKRVLSQFIKENEIKQGSIFVTRGGHPLNRSNIWRMMKKLGVSANVDEKKIFPHNLRHLFAITFYKIEKDLVRLADLLGHSSVDTTRIYTRISGYRYEKVYQRMNLLSV